MKKLLAVIVVVVVVLYYLGMQTENQPEPVEPINVPATGRPAPVSGGYGTPSGSQVNRQEVDRQAGFVRIAKQMRVELRGYKPEGSGAVISIAWKGDVASIGGDYLQACLNAGLMRDFDLPGDQAIAMEHGKRVWMARYHVRF